MKKVYIGIDIGTGGSRAIAYDQNLNIVSNKYLPHPTISNKEGKAEQSPNRIVENVLKCLYEICKEDFKIECIGISAMLHSILAIGSKGEPITPLYLWMDSRGYEYITHVKACFKDFHYRTGCVIHPMYPIIKVIWLRKNFPSLFKKLSCFKTIKSYLIYRITGRSVEDSCLASASGMFNIHSLKWDLEILKFLKISSENLPEVVDATEQLTFSKNIPGLEKLRGIPIYIGAGDGMLAHLASGGLKKNVFSSTIGTSGAIRLAFKKPFVKNKKIWCYHFFDKWWIAGGAINNGCLALNWFIRNCFNEKSFTLEKVDKLIKSVPAGSNGLIFLPFLTGERSPNWNSYMKACFIGLRVHHTEADMIRAIMEGVIYRMKAVFDIMKQKSLKKICIRGSGGYVRSLSWVQIQADIFGLPIEVLSNLESASLGAALIAMYQAGSLKNLENFEPTLKWTAIPNPQNQKPYNFAYQNHKFLYNLLNPYFRVTS